MKLLLLLSVLFIGVSADAQITKALTAKDTVKIRQDIDKKIEDIRRLPGSLQVQVKVKGVWVNADFIDSTGGGSGAQNLQQVTNIGSTTTQDITANNFKATGLPEYENNAAALAAGLEINKFYRVPYNDGKYLLAVVGPATTPPTPIANSIQSESGQPIQTESGQTIIIE